MHPALARGGSPTYYAARPTGHALKGRPPMMESLRNAAKNWVAKILLGLLAISCGVWGIQDVFRGYQAGALAPVGGVDISGNEFDRALNRQLQLYAKQTGQNLT